MFSMFLKNRGKNAKINRILFELSDNENNFLQWCAQVARRIFHTEAMPIFIYSGKQGMGGINTFSK